MSSNVTNTMRLVYGQECVALRARRGTSFWRSLILLLPCSTSVPRWVAHTCSCSGCCCWRVDCLGGLASINARTFPASTTVHLMIISPPCPEVSQGSVVFSLSMSSPQCHSHHLDVLSFSIILCVSLTHFVVVVVKHSGTHTATTKLRIYE